MDNLSPAETHAYFPSGEWEGFYTYDFGPQAEQHRMAFHLNFHDNRVSGSGSDDIGAFGWTGHYDTVRLTCQMVKQYYGRHAVFYTGNADEQGIWGAWNIGSLKGGFHIWPKSKGEELAEEAAIVEKKSIPVVTLV